MAGHTPRTRAADELSLGAPVRKKQKLSAFASQHLPDLPFQFKLFEPPKDAVRSSSTVESNSMAITELQQSIPAGPATYRATATGPVSAFDADSKRPLLTLPQEILDIIFDFAYPSQPGLRLEGRFWYEKEAEKRRDRLQILQSREYHWTEEMLDFAQGTGTKVYPGAKVESFLVSKEFFENASRAYVQNQTLDVYNVLSCIAREEKYRQRSILLKYARHLSTCDTYPGNFDFPALKTLHFTFNGSCHLSAEFGVTAPCYCDAVEYDLRDFERMPVFCALKNVRGLTRLTVTADAYKHAPAMFKKNVRAFEKFLGDYVFRPREEGSLVKERLRLRRPKGMSVKSLQDLMVAELQAAGQPFRPSAEITEQTGSAFNERIQALAELKMVNSAEPPALESACSTNAFAVYVVQITVYGWLICGVLHIAGIELNESVAFLSLTAGALVHLML